jgi:8-oxo-dGTP diphosphatase
MSYKLLVESWRKFLKENEEASLSDLDNKFDSAHIVIKNNNGAVLLLKRSESDEWMPGKWSLPGGGRREEETLIQAAIREIKEETGLNVMPEDLQFLEDISQKQDHAFFLTNKAIGTVKLDSENSEFIWADVNKLVPRDCVPDLIQVLSSVSSMKEEKHVKIPKDFEKRPFINKIKGGVGDNSKPSDFEPKELRKGIEHELEHTKDPQVSADIARNHLSQYEHYYSELEKMEKKLEKDEKEDKK